LGSLLNLGMFEQDRVLPTHAIEFGGDIIGLDFGAPRCHVLVQQTPGSLATD
jgi:hypothetical protein